VNLPSSWRWLRRDTVLAIHEAQIAEHGGALGIRDMGLLESALARPQQAAAYGEPNPSNLAALYALGISRNHPFIDGNKRVALVLLELFLYLNGRKLTASNRDCYEAIMSIAAGDRSDDDFIAWVRANTA
jgi:death-on-curing protein